MTGNMVEARSAHVSMSISHAFTVNGTRFTAFSSQFYICEVPNLISTFVLDQWTKVANPILVEIQANLEITVHVCTENCDFVR